MGKLEYSKFVLCPYYKGERGQIIYCKDEGCEEVMHMAFSTKDKLRRFRQNNCERFKNKCPIAMGLNKKWGYDDGQ